MLIYIHTYYLCVPCTFSLQSFVLILRTLKIKQRCFFIYKSTLSISPSHNLSVYGHNIVYIPKQLNASFLYAPNENILFYSVYPILYHTYKKTYYSVLGYIILIYTRMPLPAHFSPSIFHLISSVFHLLSLIFPSLPSVLPFSLNYLNIQIPFFPLLFILSFLAFGV